MLALRPSLMGAGRTGRALVLPGRTLAPLAISRAQAGGVRATGLDALGINWTEYPQDVARLLGVARRLGVEGQRTNLVENPRFEGAVAGTPGTAPTNFPIWTGSGSGITRQIVGVGVINGLPYIDVRYFGVPSSTTGISISSPTNAATAGTTYATSVWTALIAGSAANINSAIVRCSAEVGTTPLSLTPVLTRAVNIRTLSGTAALMSLRISFINTTDTVDFTLRLVVPQCELGTFASTPILPPVGAPGAATRGADLITAALGSLGIAGDGACTVLLSAVIGQQIAGANQCVLEINDGTTANRWLARVDAGTLNLNFYRVLAGAGGGPATAGVVTPGVPFRLGLTLDGAGWGACCLDGGTPAERTVGPTSGMTTLRLGTEASASGPIFGEIEPVRVLPFGVSREHLRRLVREMPR